jgi:hypothetical protein
MRITFAPGGSLPGTGFVTQTFMEMNTLTQPKGAVLAEFEAMRPSSNLCLTVPVHKQLYRLNHAHTKWNAVQPTSTQNTSFGPFCLLFKGLEPVELSDASKDYLCASV